MRWTKTLIPTLKQDPADAKIASHRLLVRAGFIRMLAAGVYEYLPLGLRSLRKAERIVREEMDRAGGIEVLLPVLQPSDLWKESGRWTDYGEDLCRFKDRHGKENVLGPTHEEVITDLVRRELLSHKAFPVTLYQIQTKFRDEVRPRFGVLRSREFLMKDAYSFHVSQEDLEKTYQAMRAAYIRIFKRAGVPTVIVEADSGAIGGDVNHEFMVPCDAGEDLILHCACGYAANRERAEGAAANVPAEPPAERREVETPGAHTVEQVAAFLKADVKRIVKTILYEHASGAVAAIVRGDHEVNEKKLARVLGGGALKMMDVAGIERATGGPLGFSGPLGIAARGVRIVIDAAVKDLPNFVVGGNKKDVHVAGVNHQRDFQSAVTADIRFADGGDACPKCGQSLVLAHGIELGHIFKLGTKYSAALKAHFADEKGAESPLLMGCYGIGVNRILAASIEAKSDKDGILWPLSIAPYEVLVVPLAASGPAFEAAEKIERDLEAAGLEVLMDDRDLRAGPKFKDADLVGIPIRVVVGEKGLAAGKAELKTRDGKVKEDVPLDSVAARVREVAREMKRALEA